MKVLLVLLSWVAVFGAGFASGVYLLPILAAPPSPATSEVQAAMLSASYRARFRRELPGSDLLHWGEGDVSVGPRAVTLQGRLAPGPAYRLYLVRGFVDTEEGFVRARPQALAVGDIRTFENFLVPLPADTRLEDYDTVVVWCEGFSRFITAAKYR
ncbi:DM13 domain-containing protein [Ramlibacter pallidus]|uniref:DM13 domain-containing protein n=1 Tax=Ramlibacter pallidus TaxID=2780087 RepID=A0ABR9S3K0_9BURK|nr:DM13 domain-containing protein [Ramlibacter pallidus]